MSAPAPKQKQWKFCQVFGDRNVENVQKADIISALEFDSTGDFLAAGDMGGRLVMFQIQKPQATKTSKPKIEYSFITEFQSHEPDFDHLRSLEIEEKINAIRFLRRRTVSHMLLTTNDKTIKLWKVSPMIPRSVIKKNTITDGAGHLVPNASAAQLTFPVMQNAEQMLVSTTKTIYGNAHTFQINSISLSPDGDSFLSSDDLRINLWSLESKDIVYNLIDMKPDNIEDINEIITMSKIHPQHSHLFVFGTNRGSVRVGDMRKRALCDNAVQDFVTQQMTSFQQQNDNTKYITDATFSYDGKYIVARDYFAARVWDTAMANRPLTTVNIIEHPSIRAKLLSHMDTEIAFDKFALSFSGDSRSFVTGTYNSRFHIYETTTGRMTAAVESTRVLPPKKRAGAKGAPDPGNPNICEPLTLDGTDFSKRIVKINWHPGMNVLAIAACSNLYIYGEQ